MTKRSNAGFSLIEVLVAVSLLAMISMLIFQGMGTVVGSKERFEKKGDSFHAGSLALNRMTRDLQSAFLFFSVEFLGVSVGGDQMTKNVFIGENNGDQDTVTFETLSHIRYLKDVKESDQAEVSYFLEPMEDGQGLFALKKRESSPPDAEFKEGGTTITLLEGIKSLNFRYYDGRKLEYVEEWDTTKADHVNRLPRSVEITLVIQDPEDEENTYRFSTVALLEMGPEPNDF